MSRFLKGNVVCLNVGILFPPTYPSNVTVVSVRRKEKELLMQSTESGSGCGCLVYTDHLEPTATSAEILK